MVEMIILKNRAEWLENRKGRIGGSEAACIVGMNPYQTNVELWEYKTGRRVVEDISDKHFTKWIDREVWCGVLWRAIGIFCVCGRKEKILTGIFTEKIWIFCFCWLIY